MLRNSSFAPAGLSHIPLIPRAYALGCILAPLRGCDSPGLRHYLRWAPSFVTTSKPQRMGQPQLNWSRERSRP